MNHVSIRKYREHDAAQVRHVCIETARAPFNTEAMRTRLLGAYCNYYITHEPHNCFVAADGNDCAVGYILCAENAELWQRDYTRLFVDTAPNDELRDFYRSTCTVSPALSERYPAHLHIDILPQYQRMGVGTTLMGALVLHLKSKQVGGLMLGVSGNNEKGINFYKKTGFTVLEAPSWGFIMGMHL